MKKMKLWVMPTAILLICLTAAMPVKTWAQAEPSERLTKLQSFIKSTVYTFNYPTVNTAGERIVLSSALVAWTPDERYDGDCTARNTPPTRCPRCGMTS